MSQRKFLNTAHILYVTFGESTPSTFYTYHPPNSIEGSFWHDQYGNKIPFEKIRSNREYVYNHDTNSFWYAPYVKIVILEENTKKILKKLFIKDAEAFEYACDIKSLFKSLEITDLD